MRIFFLLISLALNIQLFGQPAELFLKTNHTSSVNAISYSPDGALLASASADNTVKIWSAHSGELLRTLSRHRADIFCLAFSRDGSLLASAGYDRQVIIWDVRTGSIRRSLEDAHELAVTSMAFSPQGNMLATTSRDQSVKIWDVSTGQLKSTFKGHSSSVNCVTFAQGDQMVVSGDADGKIIVWDAITTKTGRFLPGHVGNVTSIAFNARLQQLASVGDDGVIHIWSATPWQLIVRRSNPGKQLKSICFGSNGQEIGVASATDVLIWDITKKAAKHHFSGHRSMIKSIASSPNNQSWATSDAAGLIQVWRAQTGTLAFSIKTQSFNVSDLAFSPGQTVLASGNEDGRINLWNLNNGVLSRSIAAHQDEVKSIAFDPTGKYVASVSTDGNIKLWNSGDGTLFKNLLGQNGALYSVCFSPDGRRLATAGQDKIVRIWEMATGQLLHELAAHLARIWSVSFSHDGAYIISAGDDYTARIWDAHDGSLLRTLTKHTALVRSARFSRNGLLAATASSDKSIKLWDVRTGLLVRSLEGHTSSVKTIAFDGNNRKMASGGFDNIIHIWDWPQGRILKTLEGHMGDINALEFSDDGRLLASASTDGSLRLWDLSSDKTKFVFTNLPSGEWIAHQDESIYYAGSSGAEKFVGLRFDQEIEASYPLSMFSSELKMDDLTKSLDKALPKISRKIARSDQDGESGYYFWAAAFVLLILAGVFSAFILRKKSKPQNEISRFFTSAGYKNVFALSDNALFLEANGKAPGIAFALDDEDSVTDKKLIQLVKKGRQKSRQDLKVYLVYEERTPIHAAVSLIHREPQCVAIPLPSATLTRSLSESKCREALIEIEERYLSQGAIQQSGKPVQDFGLLFGREELLDRLPGVLSSGKHVVLSGLAKTGLTSLALQLKQRANLPKAAYLDCSSLIANAETYLAAVVSQIEEDHHPPALIGLSFQELGKRIIAQYKSAPSRRPFLLILDGLDKFGAKSQFDEDMVRNEFEHLMQGLTSLAGHHRCVTLLTTTARPEFVLRKGVFNNVVLKNAEIEQLGFLRYQEVAQMLQTLGALQGVQWTDEAVGQMVSFCGGQPYITKLCAAEILKECRAREIDVGIVDFVLNSIAENIVTHEIGHFLEAGIWEHLKADEKELISLVASGQGLNHRDIPSDLKEALSSLENYDLVSNDVGNLSLNLRLFEIWFKEKNR